uniref:Putative Protease inhibitor/seed storage/LTP family n=1 Tax=Davidia involucrata TaxID=16924 RepID=A0A5B7BE13_DAVIN
MAIRLTLLAATFAVLLAFATASIYRTTITTVEIDEENPSQAQRCRQQIQRQRLNECQEYLSQSIRSIMLPTEMGRSRGQQLQECCQQLEEVEEQCRCEAVRRAVQQQQQQEELQGQQRREMLQSAQHLTSSCRLQPQRCDIRAH